MDHAWTERAPLVHKTRACGYIIETTRKIAYFIWSMFIRFVHLEPYLLHHINQLIIRNIKSNE